MLSRGFTWHSQGRLWVDWNPGTPHHIPMAIFAVILSILVLIFAIWLKEMGMHVFEESHHFKVLIAIAIALLIVGVVVVKVFIAPLQGVSNVASLWSAFNELSSSASGLE